MKILIQRVDRTEIRIGGKVFSSSGKGLLVFAGIGYSDDEKTAAYMADRTLGLRIFEDGDGKMNLSVKDIGGDIAVVSQFTLYADTKKGRRPGFSASAPPDRAIVLYDHFVNELRSSGLKVSEGVFGEHMEVSLTNNGPATFIIEN